MKKINLRYLLFLIPIFIIILSWFSTGKVISNNSEENLNVNKTGRYAEYYSTPWYPTGAGAKAPFHIARYPTFLLLSKLENFQIPPFLIQAIFLGILMAVGVLNMYILMKKGLELESKISAVGSVFYLLNIYSLTQVWKRFLYQGIFAWGYLPLFIFLWIKWIEKGKLVWLGLFLISSLVFSYVFTQPAHLVTFWIPAAVFTAVKIWQLRKNKSELTSILTKSLVGFMLWVVSSTWWLYPTIKLGSSWSSEYTRGWQIDFDSVLAVSRSFPIWEVLLLRQSWYLDSSNDFSNFYHHPLIVLISLIVLVFMAYGIIKSKGYRFRNYLLVIGLIGFFVSKGTNFPLGYTFFHFLFSNFPFTTALRNPYEKFGIVWLFAYSIFFSIGFVAFTARFKKNLKTLFLIIILFLTNFVLVYPFWSGGIFPPKHRLEVPEYYTEANNFLKNGQKGRLFEIPFKIEGGKMEYSWGYVGDEPPESLFDLEPVSIPKVPVFLNVYEVLPKFLNNEEFPKILGMIGVSDVILHQDNVYPAIDYDQTKSFMDRWFGVKDKRDFGKLAVYRLNEDLVKPRIYLASKVVKVGSIEEGLKKILSGEINIQDSVFLTIEIDKDSSLDISAKTPKLNFQKISNVHYVAEVKDGEDPFVLVFNNTFDKLWQAKIGGEIVKAHFMVNGFANGWLVDKKGGYKIDIKLAIWPWD